MWEQYRKTLVPIQLFALAASGTCYYETRLWPVALSVFLIMETGAVLGAFAARPKNRMRNADDRLPLEPRN